MAWKGESLIVGNPSVFAIEAGITEAYRDRGRMALGYFVIHISGRVFGVPSPTASLLACSFDAVRRRLDQRGAHVVPFADLSAGQIVESLVAVLYGASMGSAVLPVSSPQLEEMIHERGIVWAPDGDGAFDDGGHVLQFDVGTRVRLVGFMNTADTRDVGPTIVDLHLDADDFYRTLDRWHLSFEQEWADALDRAGRQ